MWKMQILRYHSSPSLYFTRCACVNEQASTNSLPTPPFTREALAGTLLRNIYKPRLFFYTTQIKNLPPKKCSWKDISKMQILKYYSSPSLNLTRCACKRYAQSEQKFLNESTLASQAEHSQGTLLRSVNLILIFQDTNKESSENQTQKCFSKEMSKTEILTYYSLNLKMRFCKI